jgi:hypothetical protein
MGTELNVHPLETDNPFWIDYHKAHEAVHWPTATGQVKLPCYCVARVKKKRKGKVGLLQNLGGVTRCVQVDDVNFSLFPQPCFRLCQLSELAHTRRSVPSHMRDQKNGTPLPRHYSVHLPTSIAKTKGSGLLTYKSVYILGNRGAADWFEAAEPVRGTGVDYEQADEDKDQ